MTDEISQLNNDIDDVEFQLLYVIHAEKGNYKPIRPHQYSPYEVVEQVDNYRNNPKNHDIDFPDHQVNDWINELYGYQSELHTAQHNSHKVVKHQASVLLPQVQQLLKDYNLPTNDKNKIKQLENARTYVNNLNNRISNAHIPGVKEKKAPQTKVSLPEVLHVIHNAANQNTYNYNIDKRDADTVETPQNSWDITKNLLAEQNYKNKTDDFLKQYANKNNKNKKGYVPYQYNGKMFYFHINDKESYIPFDGKLGYIKGFIHRNYDNNLNKQKLYENLTANAYQKLHNNLYNGNYSYDTKQITKSGNDILNNHPTTPTSEIQTMDNAMTNYQFKVQKDRIWQQYYQDKINYMNRFDNSLAKEYHGKLGVAVNKGFRVKAIYGKTTYWGLGREFGIPWQEIRDANPGIADRRIPTGYMVKIPSVKNAKYLANGDGLISKYGIGGPEYNQLIKLRNQWKAKADKLNNQLKSEQQEALSQAYLNATIDNIHADPRNGHFAYIRERNPDTEDSFVFMQVTDEQPTYSTEATATPVEWGRNITTGTQKQPTTISISGNIFNNNLPNGDGYHVNDSDPSDIEPSPSSSSDLNGNDTLNPVKTDAKALATWSDDGDEMYYCGTNMFPYCIITDFEPDFNTGSDGSLTSCSFSMTLQVVDYFQSNTNKKSGGRGKRYSRHGKSRNHGNKGTKRGKRSSRKNRKGYVIAKAGYTYGGIAIKKGISVSKIESLNKYPSREIPIGSKIYY